MSRRAVFLDRDGTLNVEKEYLHRAEDWEWIPGAVEAIRLLNQAGFVVIVTTNQSGVARGFYNEQAVRELHASVDRWLAAEARMSTAITIARITRNTATCATATAASRRPALLLAAARDHDIDLANSYVVGDKASDVGAARAVGAAPILVATGYA